MPASPLSPPRRRHLTAFLARQLFLCGIAAVAALLRRVMPAHKRRVVDAALLVLIAFAAGCYVVIGIRGLSHAVVGP
jgi:hypothetical protein